MMACVSLPHTSLATWLILGSCVQDAECFITFLSTYIVWLPKDCEAMQILSCLSIAVSDIVTLLKLLASRLANHNTLAGRVL